MKTLLSLLAMSLVIVGCGQHPIDEARSNTSDLAQELCSCPEIVSGGGYASEAECLADTELTPTDAEFECVKAAYDRNESTVSGSIECLNRQSAEAASCAREAACNAVALQRCLELFDGDECPALPETVEREFEACSGG